MGATWSHCVLRVKDIDTMIDFYCAALDFEVADRGEIGPDTEIVFLSGSPSDHHQIAFMNGRADDAKGALDHNAFRVSSVADVKRTLAFVAADDRVPDGAPVTHGNAISVYFSDPEGNGIEVFCDTPWHVPQPQIGGWNPAKSDEEILADVHAKFADVPGVMPMDEYRALKASAQEEQNA